MSDRRLDAADEAASSAPVSAHSAVYPADAAAVFALALVLRVWHVLAMRRSPFFELLMGDSLGYDSWARRIAAGDWLGTEVFYQAPLYPYFLAVLYAGVSDDLLMVRLVQAALGSFACLGLALAAGNFLQSRAAGIAAGAILAIYAPAIFHDALIQKSALDLFLLCWLLWWLSRLQDEPRAVLAAAAGASLGALTLSRENAAVLLLPVVLWLWIHYRHAGRVRVALVAALLAGVVAVLAPVALRNQAIDGDLHLTTSQFGTNFYYGNNAEADGTYRPLRFARGDPRYESADARSLAEQAQGRELDPGEISSYWLGESLDYIASQPIHWLALLSRKFVLLVNASEIIDTEDQYTHADWSPVLRLSGSVFHFGVLAPLALLGLMASWRHRQRLWLLYLMTATYAASVILFYVFARYRLPLVPFLAIFAAAPLRGGARLRERAGERTRRRPATAMAALAALLGFALLCNWTLVDRPGMRAASFYNLGIAQHEQGADSEALIHFRSALDIVPAYPEALWAAGISLSELGRFDEASSSLQAAAELRPHVAALQYSLGDALTRKGEISSAISHYREALRLAPELSEAHLRLAVALAAVGQAAAGRAHAVRAVALDEKALSELRDAAWQRATLPGLGNRGSREGELALQLARWSAQLTHPPTARSLDVLAAGFAAAGHFVAAVQTAREGLQLAQQAGDRRQAAAIQRRLTHYEAKQPFVRATRRDP